MRLIALAQDREYECSCTKCKALFAYTIKDLKVSTYPIMRNNWLGREISTGKTKDHYFVVCPNCWKWEEVTGGISSQIPKGFSDFKRIPLE